MSLQCSKFTTVTNKILIHVYPPLASQPQSIHNYTHQVAPAFHHPQVKYGLKKEA